MEKIKFNPSKEPTVGVEVESQIVDKSTGDLVNIAENIVNGYGNEERVKHELYLSTVEVTSSPALDTNNTYSELSSIFKDILELANKNNAGLIATGTHPFALYEDQVITNVNPRYEEFANKYGWAVRRLLTFGMHVHVGMDSKEKAVAVHDEIRKYLPLVLALSACSPFWRGKDTELYCSRLSVFQGLPNTGLPEPYYEWREYEQSLQTLVEADIIKAGVGYRQIWKDVRIHPAYGNLKWIIITSKNAEEVFKRLEESGIDPVLWGLTDKDFELLAKNFAQIRNQLKITNDLLDKYKEYYEGDLENKDEK